MKSKIIKTFQRKYATSNLKKVFVLKRNHDSTTIQPPGIANHSSSKDVWATKIDLNRTTNALSGVKNKLKNKGNVYIILQLN